MLDCDIIGVRRQLLAGRIELATERMTGRTALGLNAPAVPSPRIITRAPKLFRPKAPKSLK